MHCIRRYSHSNQCAFEAGLAPEIGGEDGRRRRVFHKHWNRRHRFFPNNWFLSTRHELYLYLHLCLYLYLTIALSIFHQTWFVFEYICKQIKVRKVSMSSSKDSFNNHCLSTRHYLYLETFPCVFERLDKFAESG